MQLYIIIKNQWRNQNWIHACSKQK